MGNKTNKRIGKVPSHILSTKYSEDCKYLLSSSENFIRHHDELQKILQDDTIPSAVRDYVREVVADATNLRNLTMAQYVVGGDILHTPISKNVYYLDSGHMMARINEGVGMMKAAIVFLRREGYLFDSKKNDEPAPNAVVNEKEGECNE